MELWIRSQDKLDLIKCKSIHIEEIPSSTEVAILCYASGDKYSTIGYYKSKERALEVLDEIQKLLQPQMILSKVGKPIGETCDGTVYRDPDKYDIKELSTYVYEMPQE